MAVTIDNYAIANVSSAQKVEKALTVGAHSNRILIVKVHTHQTSQTFTVKVGATSVTKLVQEANVGGSSEVWIGYLLEPAEGSITVVAEVGNSGAMAICVESWYGAKQEAPGSASASGKSAANPEVTISSETNGIVTDAVSFNDINASPTIGSEQTATEEQTCGLSAALGTVCRASYKAGAASVTMKWTQGGTAHPWGQVAAAIKTASTTWSLGAAQSMTDTIMASVSRTATLKVAQSATDMITASISRTAVLKAAQGLLDTLTAKISRTAVLGAAQSLTTTVTAQMARTAVLKAAQGMTDSIVASVERWAILRAAQSLTDSISATMSRTVVMRAGQSLSDSISASMQRTAIFKALQSLTTTITALMRVGSAQSGYIETSDRPTATAMTAATEPTPPTLSDTQIGSATISHTREP